MFGTVTALDGLTVGLTCQTAPKLTYRGTSLTRKRTPLGPYLHPAGGASGPEMGVHGAACRLVDVIRGLY